MVTLDIRNEDDVVIDRIIFGTIEESVNNDDTCIIIHDPETGNEISILKDDIDYLIKALQKAKELWHTKT